MGQPRTVRAHAEPSSDGNENRLGAALNASILGTPSGAGSLINGRTVMRSRTRFMASVVMLCAGSLLAAECAEPSLVLTEEDGSQPDGVFVETIGNSVTATYVLTNSGEADAWIRYAILEGGRPPGPFSLAGTCQSNGVIPAQGGSCTLVVTFTPVAEYTENVNLRVNYYWEGAAWYRDVTLFLTGTGVFAEPPYLSDGPTFDFGELRVGAPALKEFTFTNSSQIHYLRLGAVSDRGLGLNLPFSLANSTCQSDMILGPQQQCTLTVGFLPTALGEYSDTIDLQYRPEATGVSLVASRPLTGAAIAD